MAMAKTAGSDFQGSVCPHDCPSTCALEIEVKRDESGLGRGIGTVRGAEANSYTAGVICAKVSGARVRNGPPEAVSKMLSTRSAQHAGSSGRH